MKRVMPTEHEEQVALIQWWAYACSRYKLPEFALYAIPNGGDRHPAVAGKLKAEGVRQGVSDLFLAVPRGPHHGLFIEMKRQKGGQTSPEQKQFVAFVVSRGYGAFVCPGAEDAKSVIQQYLHGLDPIAR